MPFTAYGIFALAGLSIVFGLAAQGRYGTAVFVFVAMYAVHAFAVHRERKAGGRRFPKK